MKSNYSIFALLLSVTLFSCSSVYQTAQTPDDLYYTPPSTSLNSQNKTTQNANQEQEEVSSYNKTDNYQTIINRDDKYLRMKAANRNRWESLDDYSYWNDSRYDYNACNCYSGNYYGGSGMYSNGYGYNNYYNSYSGSGWYLSNSPQSSNYWGYYNYTPSGYGWGGYNSPVYTIIGYQQHQQAQNVPHTSGSNLATYKNNNYNNSNSPNNNNKPTPNTYIPRNNVDRPARVYTPSNSAAGGRSGGYNSTGSGASKPRSGRN